MKNRNEWGWHLLLILISLAMLAPLIVMFANSFKANEFQILKDLGSLDAFWPGIPSLENYRQVLQDSNMPFPRFLMNTLIVVSGIVMFGLVFNSTAAFALARINFVGRKIILSVIIALIIVPIESLAIPLLLMVNQWGWIDSYHVQIIPFIAHPFSIFLFYQFFIKIPKSFDEAATIDGATSFQIFRRVVVPLSPPVFMTVTILQSLEYWNSFLWPLMVTRGIEFRPLSVALAQFFGRDPKIWGDLFAFSVLSSLPIIILFLLFQKGFIQSAAGAGIKG